MGKVANSYASVIGGVSEQVAQDRREGQHKEQANMISDPVRGTARRHGSQLVKEVIHADYNLTLWSALQAGTAQHKVLSFYSGGKPYDLIYPSTEDVAGLGSAVPFWCIDKDAGNVLPVVVDASDPLVTALKVGGVSACTNVGSYVYLAGNTINTTYSTSSPWAAGANKAKFVAWVRGGAYNRKYTVTLVKPDGTKTSVSYTTKSAGYPGVLDTSDIPATAGDYQKQVNDRVNAYTSSVTAWITTSAQDQTVGNIATQLASLLTAAGVTGVSTVNGSVIIDNTSYAEILCEDAGDNTLIRGVGNEVTAAELVSTVHYVGKIVKVRPSHSNGDDAYYLQAKPKDKVSTGWTDVYWEEAPGIITTPSATFVQGIVKSGTFYMAGDKARLDTLTGLDNPAFAASVVGDQVTSPVPNFLGSKIDYLGSFQDRLVVGSANVISMSRSGDYLNFFRASVITVLDSDPIEIFALGSEGDTIKSSVTFDRNVILFGKRGQYTLNGRQTMTPANPSLIPSAYYEDAIDCEPIASGSFVFYCNTRQETAAVFQVQIGLVADSPDSYPLSGDLDTYLQGTPVSLVAVTKPNTVFLRTSTSRQQLYTYAYLDNPSNGQRVFDAWSRWEWSPYVGTLVGLNNHNGDLYCYMIKEGITAAGLHKIYFSIEKFILQTDLSDRPYLDSLRLANTTVDSSAGFINRNSTFLTGVSLAFPKVHPKRFVGTGYENIDSFATTYPGSLAVAYAGIDYTAYVTPTNPFVRDRSNKPILNGRTTITRVLPTVADSGGMTVITRVNGVTNIALNWNGRIVGDTSNLIGTQPISSTQLSAVIAKETREFEYSIYANKWLPLTLTAIEWVGQNFNNVRRL